MVPNWWWGGCVVAFAAGVLDQDQAGLPDLEMGRWWCRSGGGREGLEQGSSDFRERCSKGGGGMDWFCF